MIVLKTLTTQLETILNELKDTEEQIKGHNDKRAKTEQKIEDVRELQQQAQVVLAEMTEDMEKRFNLLEEVREEALGSHTLTVESCDNRERDMRDWLQAKIDAEDQKIKRLSEKVIKAMTEYKKEWPLETQDVDVDIEAGSEFRSMLDQLQTDDLPRFEGRFKKLLNENTNSGGSKFSIPVGP